MSTESIPAVLTLLLLATNIYWGYVNHKLIDKLMSRNYHEYQVASAVPSSFTSGYVQTNKADDSFAEDLNHVGNPF